MWTYNRPILYPVILLRNYVKWLENKSDKSNRFLSNFVLTYYQSTKLYCSEHFFEYCLKKYRTINISKILTKSDTRFHNMVIYVWGNYIFPPWTTNFCAKPSQTTNSTKIKHSTTKDNSFSPLPSVKRVKTNGQRVTWLSHAVLPSFSSYFPPMNYHHLPTCPHVKRHMTVTWPVDHFF
jgi:hypothetical protein